MSSKKVSKIIHEQGDSNNPISGGDSVDMNLKASNEQGELQILYRHVYILTPKCVPKYFIYLITKMFLDERSEFLIPQSNYTNYLAQWLKRESLSDVKLHIKINAIYKPRLLLDDSNLIWRIATSSQGRAKASSHEKCRFSAMVQLNGKPVKEFMNEKVKISLLPKLWQESLNPMRENDSVLLEINMDSPNSQYFSGTGSKYDLCQYVTSGKVEIMIILQHFIIGKNEISKLKEQLDDLSNKAQQAFIEDNLKEAEENYAGIISLVDGLNDTAFDYMKVPAMKNLALVCLNQGKYEKAEELCTSILHNDENDPFALFRRAGGRLGLRKFSEAKSDLRKVRGQAKIMKNLKLLSLVNQEMIKLDIMKNQDKYWCIS